MYSDDGVAMVLNAVRLGYGRVKGGYISEEAKPEIQSVVEKLPETEKDRLLTPLRAALQADNDRQRVNAIYILGLLGAYASPAVPDLLRSTEGRSLANIRWEVAKTLSKIGAENALPELIQALGDGPPRDLNRDQLIQRYQSILEYVAALGPSALPAAPSVVRYLGLYSSDKALSGMGIAAIPAILKHLEKRDDRKDAWVFDESARAITGMGEQASKPILDAYEQGTPDTRDVVLKLARFLKPPILNIGIAPLMARVLIDGCHRSGCHHMGTCMTVPAQTILRILGPEATPTVCEIFRSRDHNIRDRAYDILDQYKQAELPYLERVAGSAEDVTIKANVCAAILRVQASNTKALDTLVAMLSSEDTATRLAAVEAAVHVRNNTGMPISASIAERLFPHLRKAWTDFSYDVRTHSTEALGRLNVPSEPNKLPAPDVVAYEHKELPDPAAPTPDLPEVPSDDIIRASLERMFPNGMVVRRLGHAVPTEDGGMETRTEETRAPIEFTSQHITQPLSFNYPGQPRFFKRHITLLISAGWEFRSTGGPMVGSYGLFVYDGTQLTNINWLDADSKIGDVFRVEAPQLEQINPVELACFFSHTIVPGFWGQHTLVHSTDPNSNVANPSVTRTEDQGWKIEFWTLQRGGGCFVSIPVLHRHTVLVSPDYKVTYEHS